MFKNKTSQQQISNYLKQIRIAMNESFVPQFLGIKQPREFFLKHNTPASIILYELKSDDLVVVVDATYTRIEKSANIKFQYKSYSQQKMDNLIKPFIICCADGYIIDCHGPFSANENDASIFEQILQKPRPANYFNAK